MTANSCIEKIERATKARLLAHYIAAERMHPGVERFTIVVNKLVEEIGWPKQKWLSGQVAKEIASIRNARTTIANFSRPDDEDRGEHKWSRGALRAISSFSKH